MSKRSTYCCVFGCTSSSFNKPHVSFFCLPPTPSRRAVWLGLICREDLADKKAKSYVVCEEHFAEKDILRSEQRKNLKKNVVPSLKLPSSVHNEKVEAFELLTKMDCATQTEKCDIRPSRSLQPLASRKRKRPPNHSLESKVIKLSEVDSQSKQEQKVMLHKLCKRFLPKELAELIKAQTERPDKGTAKRHPLSITTEMTEKVTAMLQVKVRNMTDKERNCSLIMDTITLRPNLVYHTKEDRIIGLHEVNATQNTEPAREALVLLARGILVDWKQPVAYAMLADYRTLGAISKWIDTVLENLTKIGLHVRALVSDATPDFFALAKYKSVSPEKPFFFVGEKKVKVLYIFDAPQLLISARDSLLVNDFHFKGCVANREPIHRFHSLDAEASCRLAPKLTGIHLHPAGDNKRDPRLAAQLLSNSVASAILTYINFYAMDESGRDVVKLIKLLNDLFDTLNSYNLKDDCELRRPFVGSKRQEEVLNDAFDFFRTLKLTDPKNGSDVTAGAAFIRGFQITIRSVLILFENLKRDGFALLRTRRLNKQAITSFFEDIKTASGTNEPTSRLFVGALRQLFISSLLRAPTAENCGVEVWKILTGDQTKEDDEPLNKNSEVTFTIDESEHSVKVKRADYQTMDIPEKDGFMRFCSCLLKQCAEHHKGCQILNSYIAPAPEKWMHNFGADVRYTKYRDYSIQTSSSLLVVPYDDFISYVEKMDKEFHALFSKKHLSDIHIASAVYKKVSEIEFSPPCPCFPLVYLKKLFIRMRIFQTIKANNKKIRNNVVTRHRKRTFFVPCL